MAGFSRRDFLASSAVVAFGGCGPRRSETPLAHLYGTAWVHGAYSHYARAFSDVESSASAGTFESYGLLAERGVTALDDLQRREVPFWVRVLPDGRSFRIERDVPERLTFRADMTDADRAEATRAWKLAREHLHTDYDEVKKLDFALTRLLGELNHVRHAIDEGRIEEFRLVRQLGTLESGGPLPFELPYQVTRQQYTEVLWLVLDRIESDRERLLRTEASIVAVGLTVRATDAGSSSLGANVRKVLLAVARDAKAAAPPPLEFPADSEERKRDLGRARLLARRVGESPEYRRWLAAEQEREDVLGRLLVVFDSMTGLPVSGAYRQLMRVWRGGGDYLDYLVLAARLVPGGTDVSATLDQAVETTERYRGWVQKSEEVLAAAKSTDGRLEAGGRALVNVATTRARRQLDKQLAFYESASEADHVAEELAGILK